MSYQLMSLRKALYSKFPVSYHSSSVSLGRCLPRFFKISYPFLVAYEYFYYGNRLSHGSLCAPASRLILTQLIEILLYGQDADATRASSHQASTPRNHFVRISKISPINEPSRRRVYAVFIFASSTTCNYWGNVVKRNGILRASFSRCFIFLLSIPRIIIYSFIARTQTRMRDA